MKAVVLTLEDSKFSGYESELPVSSLTRERTTIVVSTLQLRQLLEEVLRLLPDEWVVHVR